jgi:hypothetical protein
MTTSNLNTIKITCVKCDGSGSIETWKSVNGGACYACNKTGMIDEISGSRKGVVGTQVVIGKEDRKIVFNVFSSKGATVSMVARDDTEESGEFTFKTIWLAVGMARWLFAKHMSEGFELEG